MVVGYDVLNSLNIERVLRVLKMTSESRVYKENNLIHHSDKGLLFCRN